MLANHIAWAAGLFEGEGYAGLYEHGPRIGIEMTDKDVIESFIEVFGIQRNIRCRERPNRKPLYIVEYSSKRDVRSILSKILPHLHSRRAHKALDILDSLECS